ncbi:hypothetical protein JCM10908_003453 [Rhodotorula pacifica]|uniref:uncharacterized protein n=1 Tax=Rhodotorula pacifica TaxID=1495444 RepID=UPI00316E0E5F
MQDALRRLNHPHYLACSLLCLPFPLWLASRLSSRHDLSSSLTTALLAAPVLLALSVAVRKPSDNIESFCEATTFQLRLLNLFGFVFTRNQLGTGWTAVAAYFAAWMIVSFFLPQPAYLGPSKLRLLTTEEFDTQVLLLPPAPSVAFDAAKPSNSTSDGPEPRIVELRDEPESDSPIDPAARDKYHLVLFHADYSKKSRELQMTISRLSNTYTSPHLSFNLLDPDLSPTTFYDLSLSTGPTSLDLPLLRLYRRGQPVQQVPLSEREARRAVRLRKREARRHERKRDGIQGDEDGEGSESGGNEDEEGDSDADSDDERDVAQERAMSRYRWDTSAAAIERTFKLRERSGLVQVSAT